MHLYSQMNTATPPTSRQGDFGHEMYFMVNGCANVLVNVDTPTESVISTLHKGSYFGDVALLLNSRRTCSIRAVRFCSLYSLTQAAFQNLVHYYPQVYTTVLHLARESVEPAPNENNEKRRG